MLNNISIKTKLIGLSVIVSLSFLLILVIELVSINNIAIAIKRICSEQGRRYV